MTARSLTSVLVVSVLVAARSVAVSRGEAQQAPPTAARSRACSASTIRSRSSDALLSDVLREAAPALRALGWCVTFKKPGRCSGVRRRIRKILVSDGTRIQLFEPGAPGEPGQVVETAVADSELPQALFLTGRERLEEQYAFHSSIRARRASMCAVRSQCARVVPIRTTSDCCSRDQQRSCACSSSGTTEPQPLRLQT